MGPFKHTVDDGLDIRKAAFECMYTLLDSCLDRIDVFQFLNHVESGLKDHYDIKMLTYLMTARLAQLCPGAVLQSKLYTPLYIVLSIFFSRLLNLFCLLFFIKRFYCIKKLKELKYNKACGVDGIQVETLQTATSRLLLVVGHFIYFI